MASDATLYRQLAEHIAEGRGAEVGVDVDGLHRWMVETDIGGHPQWEAFDASLDGLMAAFLEDERRSHHAA